MEADADSPYDVLGVNHNMAADNMKKRYGFCYTSAIKKNNFYPLNNCAQSFYTILNNQLHNSYRQFWSVGTGSCLFLFTQTNVLIPKPRKLLFY